MRDVRNLRYPTLSELQFLVHLHFNGLSTFKTQPVYNDPAHFRRIIKRLLLWNVITPKKIIENGRFVNAYTINGNGTILIEEFIYDYHKCVTRSK